MAHYIDAFPRRWIKVEIISFWHC